MSERSIAQDVTADRSITSYMEQAFLNYAVSVIGDRALPDVRDGLKPVHRYILTTMYRLGLTPNKAYAKSGLIVGRVLGTFHPHGDVAIYDAAARMAQPWSLLHPLIDGQGNFGSLDGDPPAAMRYTEMRLTPIATTFFELIDKEVIDTRPNYDGTLQKPTVLPVPYPNILVNGTDGIAVGMATSCPPHNLAEALNAFLAFIENPEISIEEIAALLPAPDFPTGGIVHSLSGFLDALRTGQGSVKLRGEWHEEQKRNGASRLVLTELPWRINKAHLVESIATLVRDGKIDDIIGLTDESARGNVRIVLDLAKGTNAETIANALFALTKFETTISYNMTFLLDQQPSVMGIREIFTHFFAFRRSCIERAARHDAAIAHARLHLYNGYLRALDRLDATIAAIRTAPDRASARERLITLLAIDNTQAQAILELQLQRLTSMDTNEIKKEQENVQKNYLRFKEIEESQEEQKKIIIEETMKIKELYGQERKTTIADEIAPVAVLDCIEDVPVTILATRGGYLQRVPRGEKRRKNGSDEEDPIATILPASLRDTLFACTEAGQVHAVRVADLPAGGKGRHATNLFEGLEGAILRLFVAAPTAPAGMPQDALLTVTARGTLKRTLLAAYEHATRKGGIFGVTIEPGDRLVAAARVRDGDHLLLCSSGGQAIRVLLDEKQLRLMGRASVGNCGMTIEPNESIIGVIVLDGEQKTLQEIDKNNYLCIVSEKGVVKKIKTSEFRVQARAGKGVSAFEPTAKSGALLVALGGSEDSTLVLERAGASTSIGHSAPAIDRYPLTDLRTSARTSAPVALTPPGIRLRSAWIAPSLDLSEGVSA